MEEFDSPLTNLKIASPCSANWNAMQGNERKRFCSECKLSVYNLSGMTRYDAENLLRLSEGRLCVRYYQRADGTILTADCPVGWALIKKRWSVFVSTAAAILISIFGGLLVLASFGKGTRIVKKFPIPFVTPTPAPAIMGAVTMPTPTPATQKNEMLGRPARPAKIDDGLREQVLRQAGI